MKKANKTGWIIVTFIIVAVVVFRIVQGGRKEEKAKMEVPTEVVVEKAVKKDMLQTLEYTGNIVGQVQVQIHPIEETGRLMKYLVKEGDKVSKGDVIALVDRSIKGMEFQPAKITSPISGTVAMLFLDRGAIVSPQIPIAIIAQTDKVKVEIQIVEKDIPKVKKGQPARIRVDAYPEEIFIGNLEELSSAVNPLSKTLKGKIIITNQLYLLKPGMFARVELIIAEHKGKLVVPNKAVLKREGREIIFTDIGGTAKLKEVETGFKDETHTEIINGLEENERVIVLGNYGLRDEAKIKVKE